jgi:hypothetical protein
VIGLVGDGDPNLTEHDRAEELLSKRGYWQWQEVFKGAHQWPEEGLFRHAVELLEIVAMRREQRPRDDELIARVSAEQLKQVDRLREEGSPILALRKVRQIEGFFAEPEVVDAARRVAAEILAEPGKADLMAEERKFVEDLAALNNWTDLENFRNAASEMRRRMDQGGPFVERSRLALHLMSIYLNRFGLEHLQKGKPEEAFPFFHGAAWTYPENPVGAYNGACAAARLGDTESAITLLKSAARNRFNDLELLRRDSDLDSLRSHAEYSAIESSVARNQELGLAPPAYAFAAGQPSQALPAD